MKKKIALILIFALLFSLVSCTVPKEEHTKPTIVTTNFAMYDFARAVVGDLADVTMLLAPGSESHDFELKITDMAQMEKADFFVYNGGESEVDWVNAALTSIYAPPESVAALLWCKTYEEEIVEGMEVSEEEAEEEGAIDEHCWTSIDNAILIVNRIAERLCDRYDEYAEEFRANADSYTEKLKELAAEYRDMIDSAKRKTVVVADRFPFRYLAEEFGLDYYAAFAGCTSATEPSLATVNFLIEKVNTEQIPAIFVIEFSDGVTARAVAEETGCEVLTLHSAHNVTREDFENGVTYIDLMRRNLDALKIALN